MLMQLEAIHLDQRSQESSEPDIFAFILQLFF